MSKRAIVTGGAGFIGSHVADALLADGCEVRVIDDLSSGAAERVPSGAELVELDIVEERALREAFDRFEPHAVYHLAAQASVVASVADPGRDADVNVRGTLNVLEAAGAHGAPVVFTSTGGALYGDEAPRPTPEERIPAPLSPYGSSKWAAEAFVQTWSRLSGIQHTVARLGNVYGPRQSPHGEAGVVAIFTGRINEGKPPKLYGHGRPTRDYIYVADVVGALLAATGKAGVYNIATGTETDVTTIWQGLCEIAGVELEPELAELRPGELQHSCLDIARAKAELGWSPEVEFARGLEITYRELTEELAGA